jgi:hypothetical protein
MIGWDVQVRQDGLDLAQIVAYSRGCLIPASVRDITYLTDAL